MLILDAGFGFIFFGMPIALILSTIFVAFIEALYLNQKIKNFKKTLKATVIVNLLSSFCGFLFTFILIFSNFLKNYSLKYSDGYEAFLLRIALLVILFLITIFLESFYLKNYLLENENISNKDIINANLITYLIVSVCFFYV